MRNYVTLASMLAERKPRIAIGSIMHESNSFNAEVTQLSHFRIREGPDTEATLRDWRTGNSEVAGFVEEGERRDLELLPILYASATPNGPVTSDAFETLTARLVEGIRNVQNLDGILLALHGAMFTEEFPQGDEEIVRRVREAVGNRVPLVVTHDFHANISPQTVELTDVLITYQQNPHTDTKQRGILAASILSRMLAGEVNPCQTIVKPAVLWNIVHQDTSQEPLRAITQASMALERCPGILAASVAGGYQYNDVPFVGPSVIVVSDGNAELAEREARQLADRMEALRSEVRLNLPDARSAVKAAIAADRFPVALFDVGDNVGGGGTADETTLLAELLEQQAKGWVAVLNDPAAVSHAQTAGIGGAFDLQVGGRSPSSFTSAIPIKGVVRSLHQGRFIETAVRHGGHRYWDMGHSAVIEAEGSTPDELNLLLVTSERCSPFSLHQLISCGIYPERQKIIIVKGTVAPRAAYEPVAAEIRLVDTPGVTAANPARFEFRRARPGISGLNADW
jgi:microcystin degradation protein MlrC